MIFAYKPGSGRNFSSNQIEKLGNVIIYLAEHIKPLYKTKLLKLLYLIEEVSIKINGIPFFGIDFELWKLGPVQRDVFVDLSDEPSILKDFIRVEYSGDGTVIAPKKLFSDDEFSDKDMEILEIIATKFKDKSAQDLIDITHRKNSPWHLTAVTTGYLELFEKNQCNATSVVLDLSSLLDEVPERKEFYISTLEFQKLSQNLKGLV